MFLHKQITGSTKIDSRQIERLQYEVATADAILIGAGAGLSASAGLTYSGERFEKTFSDFHQKYGITDMYAGGFYPYDSLEEYWAWWSRQIVVNRYDAPVGEPYTMLLHWVKDKDYFVLTTNVDHQFQRAGFDKRRLFYTQGDYGLWQCSKTCRPKTYDNEKAVRILVAEQRNMRVPTELIPRCPVCGAPMTMNLRCDDQFVQDAGWYEAKKRYDDFVRKHKGLKTVYLELGVGMNTPGVIKFPFWRMTAENSAACYVNINKGEAFCPSEIERQCLCVNADIAMTIQAMGPQA